MNFIKEMILFIFLSIPICLFSRTEGLVIDKIVAIVGNEIIMKSDIDGKLQILKYQDKSIDINDPKIRKQILESLINENLIITKAIEDSIVVSDDEINTEWEKFKENLVNYYGSIDRVEDIYGMSLTRIQFEYRDIIKKQLLAQKMQQKKFMNIKITQKEVEDFYNKYKDSLPNIPEQVELYHIVKYVQASRDAKEKVYELAKKVRDSILQGGLFSDFAKRYSQDPGSAIYGGELGWVAKGKLFKEFEKAAFELVPGKTSLPVETPFGYHLIQTLDKNNDSVLVRHILFRFGNSPDDIQKAINFLKSIKDSIKNGLDFETLAKKYSDDYETKGFGGKLGVFTYEQIPLNLQSVIENLNENEISEPQPYNIDPTKPAYHIIFKKKIIPSHKPNLKDDYKILEQKALSFKQLEIYNNWIEELRKELYWEIKDDNY